MATQAGIVFSPNVSNLTTHESGDTVSLENTFGVHLATQPRHDVYITLTISDSTEAVFKANGQTSGTLKFTPGNWDQWQGISLLGVDDKELDMNVSFTISTKVKSDDLNYDGMRSGDGLPIQNIIGINVDDDGPDEYYGDSLGIVTNDYYVGGNGPSDLYGLSGRDELYGGNGDDRIYGGYGDDVLYGEGDNDELEGEAGTDKLYGGTGDDNLKGGTGNDKLYGEDGNDILNGGEDADDMDGGNGGDTYYVDNPKDIVVDTGTDTGADVVYINSYISSTFAYTLGAGIESATLTDDAKDADLEGNLSDNTLTGNSFDNLLNGGGGADSLDGGAGKDNLAGGIGDDGLAGGKGKDKLSGGGGADKFVFKSVADSGSNKSSQDVITDFSHASGDKVDLSGIDANVAVSGDQSFTLVNNGFSGNAAGQLYFNATTHVLYGSTDADTQAEFSIQLTGLASFVTDDFFA